MSPQRALVVVTDAQHSLLRSTFREIALGLRELGLEVGFRIVESYQDIRPEVEERLARGENFFLVDGNCKFRLPETPPGFRRFSYVTDAPWGQMEHVLSCQGEGAISYVDRTHAAFYQDFPCRLRQVFLPHGGPVPDPSSAGERDIDLLFVGNLLGPCRMEHFREATAGLGQPWPELFAFALEMILEEGLDPYTALKAALLSKGLTPAAAGLSNVLESLGFLSRFAESHNRWRLLTALAGRSITVCGLLEPQFFGQLPAGVDYRGLTDEEGVIALMRRAKVLLNSVSVFPAGSHERIWYGMAHGAVVCSERSRFVEETLRFGDHLLSLEQAVDSRGASLDPWLGDSSARAAMSEAASVIYADNHTWRHRAAIIHEAMRRSPVASS
ncbi:MAG: hypothetical protein FD176_1764 [Rhodospirillaceae bacterium]|nr:MAG: hypothetical protein FD176_1764 [Rhodospirillaceae bacterium]TNC96249.1 MAG: hypothetical protein FD119_1849 [Stygiobacter sp.]